MVLPHCNGEAFKDGSKEIKNLEKDFFLKRSLVSQDPLHRNEPHHRHWVNESGNFPKWKKVIFIMPRWSKFYSKATDQSWVKQCLVSVCAAAYQR